MARLLTKCYQRTREEAVGCWGGGGAVAVMEKRRGRAGTGDGYGGCYGAEAALLRELRTAKESREMKNGERGE